MYVCCVFWLFSYSIVVDCTDNVATRYLLNDSCVLLEKPLVSGSALRFEGQVCVCVCVCVREREREREGEGERVCV